MSASAALSALMLTAVSGLFTSQFLQALDKDSGHVSLGAPGLQLDAPSWLALGRVVWVAASGAETAASVHNSEAEVPLKAPVRPKRLPLQAQRLKSKAQIVLIPPPALPFHGPVTLEQEQILMRGLFGGLRQNFKQASRERGEQAVLALRAMLEAGPSLLTTQPHPPMELIVTHPLRGNRGPKVTTQLRALVMEDRKSSTSVLAESPVQPEPASSSALAAQGASIEALQEIVSKYRASVEAETPVQPDVAAVGLPDASVVNTQAPPAEVLPAMAAPLRDASLHPESSLFDRSSRWIRAAHDQAKRINHSEGAATPTPQQNAVRAEDQRGAIAASTSDGQPVGAVEAFTSAVQWLSNSGVRWLSREGAVTNQASGWFEVSAPDHLTTLTFGQPTEGGAVVPLLSLNTHQALLKLAGLSDAPTQTGTLVVRTSAEWQARLIGGRAEAVTGLPEGMSVLPPGLRNAEGERTWVWTHAQPGAHWLQLIESGASEVPTGIAQNLLRQAGVTTLIKPGTVTYLDLRQVREVQLSGMVLDASQPKSVGIPDVVVKVIGQSVASATTEVTGGFVIAKALQVSNHPLEMETRAGEGYPHRYRIRLEAGKPALLFRFSESHIERWLGQLRGGLSPASGLLLAAVPEVASVIDRSEAAVTPHVAPLLESALLQPETYTLGGDDQLLVHQPLDANSPRFLALQLPEGANRASLDDQRGVEVWSDVVISSPGVVNVIAPR